MGQCRGRPRTIAIACMRAHPTLRVCVRARTAPEGFERSPLRRTLRSNFVWVFTCACVSSFAVLATAHARTAHSCSVSQLQDVPLADPPAPSARSRSVDLYQECQRRGSGYGTPDAGGRSEVRVATCRHPRVGAGNWLAAPPVRVCFAPVARMMHAWRTLSHLLNFRVCVRIEGHKHFGVVVVPLPKPRHRR